DATATVAILATVGRIKGMSKQGLTVTPAKVSQVQAIYRHNDKCRYSKGRPRFSLYAAVVLLRNAGRFCGAMATGAKWIAYMGCCVSGHLAKVLTKCLHETRKQKRQPIRAGVSA